MSVGLRPPTWIQALGRRRCSRSGRVVLYHPVFKGNRGRHTPVIIQDSGQKTTTKQAGQAIETFAKSRRGKNGLQCSKFNVYCLPGCRKKEKIPAYKKKLGCTFSMMLVLQQLTYKIYIYKYI